MLLSNLLHTKLILWFRPLFHSTWKKTGDRGTGEQLKGESHSETLRSCCPFWGQREVRTPCIIILSILSQRCIEKMVESPPLSRAEQSRGWSLRVTLVSVSRSFYHKDVTAPSPLISCISQISLFPVTGSWEPSWILIPNSSTFKKKAMFSSRIFWQRFY